MWPCRKGVGIELSKDHSRAGLSCFHCLQPLSELSCCCLLPCSSQCFQGLHLWNCQGKERKCWNPGGEGLKPVYGFCGCSKGWGPSDLTDDEAARLGSGDSCFSSGPLSLVSSALLLLALHCLLRNQQMFKINRPKKDITKKDLSLLCNSQSLARKFIFQDRLGVV